mgnify:CR=1 FL=1
MIINERFSIHCYDELVKRFENIKGELQKEVAFALHNKSIILRELQISKFDVVFSLNFLVV